MYRTQCVLALLALYVGLAHSFSWDIILTGREQLQFYNNNGTLTHTEVIPSHYVITSIAYDPVHNRVLFAGSDYISSFDIATRKIQPLVRSTETRSIWIAYDPATQLLFWVDEGYGSINSFLAKPGSNTAAADLHRNLLIDFGRDGHDIYIAVDSCGGYIYWTTYNKIERARFDGSERKTVIDKQVLFRNGLTIDQHTQKMYWLDIQNGITQIAIESADLNGENRRTLYNDSDAGTFKTLTVSKDFINLGLGDTFWRIPKNPPRDRVVEPKAFFSIPNTPLRGLYDQGIATNYKIEDQTQGIQNCEALKNLLPINSVPNDYDSLNDSIATHSCVHGTKVSGESRCECTQGYSGERCDGSVCHNYCFQGDCSVSAERQPKCRCNAGYSGDRCEINACHNYCLNNGVCSLNEKNVTPVSLGKGVKSTCASTAV